MCFVLLVIQLLSMNGFVLFVMDFFPVCHCAYPFSSLSDPWCYLQTPFVWAEFVLSVVDFFLSFTPGHVYQSSMFRLVDMLCAVS